MGTTSTPMPTASLAASSGYGGGDAQLPVVEKGLDRAASPTEVLQRWDGHHQTQERATVRRTALNWWTRRNLHQSRGKCSQRASTGPWLCRHLVEMELTLVEIDEIDELQKGTMGQNLHRRMMKMRMKMHPRSVWASSGGGCSQGSARPPCTGTEAEDEAPRWTWRPARRLEQSSMERGART